MNIEDFGAIDRHPWDCFGKAEIEGFMWWFLKQCKERNDIDAVIKTKCNEDNLCAMNLLVKEGEQEYRLTEYAKGRLWNFYKRDFLGKDDMMI